VNAAELNRLHEERRHSQPISHTGETCWCGLCHCPGCQLVRQELAELEKKGVPHTPKGER
jgi:hypothetical protein